MPKALTCHPVGAKRSRDLGEHNLKGCNIPLSCACPDPSSLCSIRMTRLRDDAGSGKPTLLPPLHLSYKGGPTNSCPCFNEIAAKASVLRGPSSIDAKKALNISSMVSAGEKT